MFATKYEIFTALHTDISDSTNNAILQQKLKQSEAELKPRRPYNVEYL